MDIVKIATISVTCALIAIIMTLAEVRWIKTDVARLQEQAQRSMERQEKLVALNTVMFDLIKDQISQGKRMTDILDWLVAKVQGKPYSGPLTDTTITNSLKQGD